MRNYSKKTVRWSKRQKWGTLVLLGSCFFAVVACTLPDSLGRMLRSIQGADAAAAAKFAVRIEAPPELAFASPESAYQHYFPHVNAEKSFDFTLHNEGEVTVRCTPRITNGVQYRVCAAGADKESFVLRSGESAAFQLTILTEGLQLEITQAALTVDIEQVKGGASP